MVCSKPKAESLNPRYIKGSVKHGCGNIIVLVCKALGELIRSIESWGQRNTTTFCRT